MTSIGERIKNRRNELGLTQEELAHKLGYKSRAAISNVEKGLEDLTTTRVKKYAEALDCTPSFLLGWDDEPSNKDMLVVIKGNERSIANIIKEDQLIELKENHPNEKIFSTQLDYFIDDEITQNLLIEVARSNKDDIKLATEFLMRLNRSSHDKDIQEP